MSPFFLAASAVFGLLWLVALLGLSGVILGMLVCLAAWGAWRSGHHKARKAGEILLALVATGQGVLESLRGKTYQTWTPAQSRNT